MTQILGDQPIDTTLIIPFDSFGADGESLVISGLATTDVKIYKDGGITQRTGVSGITLLDTDGISFDGIVGINGISIDLSDNDDVGFYAADGSYFVVIDSVTINTQTVSFIAATWTIEIANGAIARAKALALVATETRLAELDAGNLPTDIAAIPTTAMRGTDSAALASVATEARLAELDAGNLPTDIAAIPTTAMRGTDSAALASVATEARLAELDAGNLPTDVAAITTTAMRGTDSAATEAKQDIMQGNVTDILADTGEMQGEQADGGRLDLIWDAIFSPISSRTWTRGRNSL